LGVQYIYPWKYHKATPCVDTFISNKNVMFFFLSFLFCKIGKQEGVTGLAQGKG
jgi:hypothetical protein